VHLVGFTVGILLWCTALWTSNLSHIHCYGIQYSISCSTYLLLNVLHVQFRLYFLAIWIKLHFFMLQFPSHNKNTHFLPQNFHQMHQCIKFILFWNETTCFGRSFCPSSGVQGCTYSNRHLSNRYCCLLASGYLCMYRLELLMMDWKTVRNM